MKVATWNVNSVRTRKEHVKDWLAEHQADLLCLQETKVVDPDFPQDFFQDLGYHLCFSGQKSYNGVAIFSKEPLGQVTRGFGPILGEDTVGDLDDQKRVISGIYGDFRIVNLYVPNGSEVGSDKYAYKLRWLATLKDYLATLQRTEPREICICGDFNIALEHRDIYDNGKGKEGRVMFSEEEKTALREILDLGFQDAFRKFNQGDDQFTWWDYRTRAFSRNRGWRIDHFYLTENLYHQAQHCWIDTEPRKREKPSDHTPVIVEF